MIRLICAAVLTLLAAVCVVIPLGFWVTGLCLLALASVLAALYWLDRRNKPVIWRRLLIALTAFVMALVLGAMTLIAVKGRQDDHMDQYPEFAVVLGAQIHGDQPSLTLRRRLDKAAEYLQDHPQATVIVSGGQGADELQTEASVMREYLIQKQIAPERIVEEPLASDTRENLQFSAALAEELGMDTKKVLIITSDFHQLRAKYIARSLGMEPYGLSSKTAPWILKINFELREVFAFVKAWWLAR